jgi:periplasmic divalent cation tolerance protein
MKILYVTLNNDSEARKISRKILKAKLANCTNWFPITCMYNYEGKIEEEPEVVLIVKTLEGNFEKIEEIIKSEIDYTNFISQFDVEKVNGEFLEWINLVVNNKG